MISGLEMMACQNLSVPPALMYHVAQVESHSDPYAIGVVDGRLVRQPGDLAEAIATVKMLEAKGYNFSVGLAQINKANLVKYGLDTWKKAFSVCPNLVAGSRILAGCYAAAHGVWGKAFSCYYSGDFTTGYRDGYVHKIYASLSHGRAATAGASKIAPIVVLPTPRAGQGKSGALHSVPNGAAYRVAIRSELLDSVAGALVLSAARSMSAAHTNKHDPTAAAAVGAKKVEMPSDVVPVVTRAAATTGQPFVPKVMGPNEASAVVANTAPGKQPPALAKSRSDPAAVGQVVHDAAFVF